VKGLKAIRDYLRWWGDPRGVPLAVALNDAQRGPQQQEKAALAFAKEVQAMPISPVPEQAKALINLVLGNSPDILVREVALGRTELKAMVFHTDNLIKKEFIMGMLDNLVIRLRDEPFPTEPEVLKKFLEQRCFTIVEVTQVTTIGDITHTILGGDTILVVEGLTIAFNLATRGWEHRTPEEPTTEPVVRGPKEGFVETGAVNVAMVRRRLLDNRLRVEMFTVGTRSHTLIWMVYLSGLAVPSMLEEARKRVRSVKVDAILESGMLKEFIEDTPWTVFPLMKATERPDVVAGELLEGKFCLIVDGTPHSLVGPATFAGGMQAAEDYYERWPAASFTRFLRYLFLMVALLGPSVYVAMTTFHHEMLPTDLLLSLMAAREGVPFPSVVEALLMELSFEALREAGVRLPKTVGQTVSIVGALVIGEAAVKAGLVSPVMVIVVAITGISSFVIPNFSTALAIRLLRFPMMFLAGTFGFYGTGLGLLILSIHLSGLRSFGVPYMSPTMPPTAEDMKDLMIRAPWWYMRKRPKFMPVSDRIRQPPDNEPKPPEQQ
jgi:hypothetical protein